MKRKFSLQVFLAALAAFFVFDATIGADRGAQPASTPDYLSFKTEDEANNVEIFNQASPSVVYVTNTALRRESYFSRNLLEIPQGSGTGFVWSRDGLIVTNYHVVRGANRISITLNDHTTWDAEVVGLAEDKDLALLRIDAPPEKLTPLPLGNSSQLEVGRKVIAIGNPFGLDTTLTVGVVSALGREIRSLTNRTIRDVIQTDASINPGNSGGPLLNSLGQLVGVNTMILSPSGASAGIGFAIPVNTVKKIVPQLEQYGREVRPSLGAEYYPDSLARQRGVRGVAVLRAYRDQPAERAGIVGFRQNRRGDVLFGDIIIAIDDNEVESQDDLFTILEQHKAGDAVTVVTLRDGQVQEYEVELAGPEAEASGQRL